MLAHYLKSVFMCLLLSFSLFSTAQKNNIALSNNLAENADELKVKMGTQGFGKIWKFRFGDYEVVSSKMGWTTTSSKGSIFNLKTETSSSEKFSFVLANKSQDKAKVNAAKRMKMESLREIEILPSLTIGGDVLKESGNFTAFISINEDTTNTWALLMNVVNVNEGNNTYNAYLTNGERKIFIIPVTSNDGRSIPALGYEFVENGIPHCAMQYYGGGTLGMNKNIIWLGKQLDEPMKLILAAAMTALLQINVTASVSGL